VASHFNWPLHSPEQYKHSASISEFSSQVSRRVINQINPITGLRCPEDFRKLRFSDFVITAQDGGKVVSLTHRPLFTPRKYSWYSFLLEAQSTSAP